MLALSTNLLLLHSTTPKHAWMHTASKAVIGALQARDRLLLRLQDHLHRSLPCHTLNHAWQQCRQQILQDTCLGSRLAIQLAAANILAATPPSTYIVSMHVAHDGSMLYCTALRGQQAAAAPAKGKAGKPGQSVPAQKCLYIPDVDNKFCAVLCCAPLANSWHANMA